MSDPQRRKGSPRDAGSPMHPQRCCPWPGPVLCGQGAGAGAEPQWHSCCPGLSGQPPALAQVSCPRWGSSPHPSPHQLQRDMILENSAPLPLHPLYSITFPFKLTFLHAVPRLALTSPKATPSGLETNTLQTQLNWSFCQLSRGLAERRQCADTLVTSLRTTT